MRKGVTFEKNACIQDGVIFLIVHVREMTNFRFISHNTVIHGFSTVPRSLLFLLNSEVVDIRMTHLRALFDGSAHRDTAGNLHYLEYLRF